MVLLLRYSASLHRQSWAAACPPIPGTGGQGSKSKKSYMCFSHAKESSRVEFQSKFVTPAKTLSKFSFGKHRFLDTITVKKAW